MPLIGMKLVFTIPRCHHTIANKNIMQLIIIASNILGPNNIVIDLSQDEEEGKSSYNCHIGIL